MIPKEFSKKNPRHACCAAKLDLQKDLFLVLPELFSDRFLSMIFSTVDPEPRQVELKNQNGACHKQES